MVELRIDGRIRCAHSTTTQRSAIAAELANMPQGKRTDSQLSANLQNVFQTEAAATLNVSRARWRVLQQLPKCNLALWRPYADCPDLHPSPRAFVQSCALATIAVHGAMSTAMSTMVKSPSVAPRIDLQLSASCSSCNLSG